MSNQDPEQEKQIMEGMEANVGRQVTFLDDDGERHWGRITGVSNSEHYAVLLDYNGWPWPWLVRREAINFVEEIRTRI